MKRFDEGKKFQIKTLLCNDRLKAYRTYIEYAQEKGYKVCSMMEFWNNRKEGRHFVLRHDVDHSGISTKKMYMLERDCGVHSTYYFRKETINPHLMKDMVDNGFEVGFHYETLGEYAVKNNLNSVTDYDIKICRNQLKADIREFNSVLGSNISSAASHGTAKNTEIGKSNNVLLENEDYNEYGLCFEAYDQNMYENDVDAHIMDCNLRYNYGFSYKDTPIDAINEGAKNIIFLAHPNHWYNKGYGYFREIVAYIAGRRSYGTNRVFHRILQ